MSKTDLVIDAMFNVAERALNGEVGRFLCGEYLDGTIRSVPDALSGEMRSPKQRKKDAKKAKEAVYQEIKTTKKKKGGKKKKKKKATVLKL